MALPFEKMQTYAEAFVSVSIILGLSVMLLSGFESGAVTNTTVVNESIDNTSIILGSPFFLAGTNTSYFIEVDNGSVRCYNGSFEFLQVGNYTTYANGSVTPIFTGMIDANSNLSVNYTYTYGSEERTTHTRAKTAVMEYSEWLDEIILVLVATILIGMVRLIQISRKRSM